MGLPIGAHEFVRNRRRAQTCDRARSFPPPLAARIRRAIAGLDWALQVGLFQLHTSAAISWIGARTNTLKLEVNRMIRDATEADFDAILRLNFEAVHFLSPMDSTRLAELHAQAAFHRVILVDDEVAGFLLALKNGAAYDSENYAWFSARYPAFLYIDRVVVDVTRHKLGLGSALYRDLFDFARGEKLPAVACEYDVMPPNAASAAFHARFSFAEVGTRWVSKTKKVSLQLAPLTAR